MRSLPHDGVFSVDDLRALGWSDAARSRAVAAGRIVRVRRGFYTAGAPTEVQQAEAAVRAVSGSAVSHRSNLLVRGLPLVGSPPRLPEITVPPWATGDTRHAALHRAAMPACDVEIVAGLPLLSLARTLIDVARSRPLSTAVPAMDAALNRRLLTPDDLDDQLLRCWNWPGIRRAQRAVRLSDGRAESPLESISRLVTAAPMCSRSRRNVRSCSRTPGSPSSAGGGSNRPAGRSCCEPGSRLRSVAARSGTDQVFPASGRLSTRARKLDVQR